MLGLGPKALVIRSLVTAGLIVRARKHKSLTDLALVAAFLTAVVHSIHPWSLCLALLMAFYMSGTKFTKYKHELKKDYTVVMGDKSKSNSKEKDTENEGGEGPRNHIQVLANSIVASMLILAHLYTGNDMYMFGVIANYAAVTADTWSSELGILSQSQPILITTLRPCPRGTNGGVSKLGLTVAVAGGFFIGVIAVLMAPMFDGYSVGKKLLVVAIVSFLGFYGSVLDSALGAALQKSVVNKQGKIVEAAGGYKLEKSEGAKVLSGDVDLLSNNQVNLLMAALTSTAGLIIYTYIN